MLTSRPAALLIGLCAALADAACADDDLGQVYGVIAACRSLQDLECRTPLDLGVFRAGEQHSTQIALRNLGNGDLNVHGVEVVARQVNGQSSDLTVLRIEQYPTQIPANAAATVAMRADPGLGQLRVTLAVASDDPSQPRFTFDVQLEGVGPTLVICPTEGLHATPDVCAPELAVDVSDVRPSQQASVVVLVRNTGASPLEMLPTVPRLDLSAAGEMSVETSLGAGTLDAGEDRTVLVRYAPVDTRGDSLTATFTPVDTEIPPAVLRITSGTHDNQPPIAVATDVASGRSGGTGNVGLPVWLDGRSSRDPEGDPLHFEWTWTGRPEGSPVALQTPAAKLTRFVPDRLGEHVARLVVTDSLGAQDAAEVIVWVVPFNELVIEASWRVLTGADEQAPLGTGDVDLHVVPAGDPLFGSTDCYFLQPTVNWGRPTETTDNPVLLDDANGSTGLERIEVPRPVAGPYDIYLHYFDAQDAAAVRVEVQVWRDDRNELLDSAADSLRETCETWKVGTLQWPSGTLVPATAAHTGVCYPGSAR